MKRKVTVSLVAGIPLSAAALYLSFINIPLKDLLTYLPTINIWWIPPAVLTVIAAMALRAFRWRVILLTTKKIDFRDAFHPMMIGLMMNCILPGRVGELARPVILKKEKGIPFSTGLATIAADRAFDMLSIILFLVLVLSVVDIDPSLNVAFGNLNLNSAVLEKTASGMARMGFFLIAIFIFMAVETSRNVLVNGIQKMPLVFAFTGSGMTRKIQHLCDKTSHVLISFSMGFALVKKPGRLIFCMLLSILIWLVSALSYYLFSLGCPGVELSFLQVICVMVIVAFFIALPSVPGFWGLWEAGGIFALAIFGIPAKEAAGYTLANHIVQLLPIILIGLLSAFITSINILKLSADTSESSLK